MGDRSHISYTPTNYIKTTEKNVYAVTVKKKKKSMLHPLFGFGILC